MGWPMGMAPSQGPSTIPWIASGPSRLSRPSGPRCAIIRAEIRSSAFKRVRSSVVSPAREPDGDGGHRYARRNAQFGHGINNAGQIAGYSYTTGNAATHAFLWTPGSGMLDLGTLGGPTASPMA